MRAARKKAIMIKANEINEADKANEATKTKKSVNSKIRISIIIFTIKEPREKRVLTRKRKFEIIKNFVNMFFIKRLCNIYAYKKNVF